MKNWNLKCFLFGHKFVVKALTDKTFQIDNGFRKGIGYYYIYEQEKFCVRCGIKNQNYEEIKKIK